MIKKPVQESKELKILRCLNSRMELPLTAKQNFSNLDKGHRGEKMFNELLKGYHNDWLILNDLLLNFNNSLFQIDTLIISQKSIYVFEIKNFDGDYYVEDKKWYSMNEKEIKDPLLQLKRSESLLRGLLKELRIYTPIVGRVVFINPEFTLFQAPRDEPILLPNQLNRFMKSLTCKPSQITQTHVNISDRLLSLHIEDSPYSKLPTYTINDLDLGINCMCCSSLNTYIYMNKLVCRNCGYDVEAIDDSILRSVTEFKLLFPDNDITVKSIYEWCNGMKSKKTIRRILAQRYELVYKGHMSHYLLPVENKGVCEGNGKI